VVHSWLMKWIPTLVSILAEIHKRAIIHCDIKPNNIIITPKGDPIIIDFGLSVPTNGFGYAGTNEFGSKNAVERRGCTCEDDFISLCYTLYSLEVGYDAWKAIVEKGRPSLKKLLKQSNLIKYANSLWINQQ